MADRFCPSCGTEVEADARFCPSCGTTLTLEGDEEQAGRASPLPPAPAWPSDEAVAATPPTAGDEPTLADSPLPAMDAPPEEVPEPWPEPAHEPEPQPEAAHEPQPEPEPAQPEPAAPAPPPAASATPPPPPPAAPVAHSVTPVARSNDIPVTWPTTVAGWLIGAGSLLGAIFLIASLGNVVSLLLFVALLGISATVFAADRIPEIPQLRLLVLVTTMIGLGVGLARAGFTVAGADTLFLLAMLAAAGGALLIELDRDRPWPPPERSGG